MIANMRKIKLLIMLMLLTFASTLIVLTSWKPSRYHVFNTTAGERVSEGTRDVVWQWLTPLSTAAPIARSEAPSGATTTDAPEPLAPCPETPPRLVGALRVEFDLNRTMEEVRTRTLMEDARIFQSTPLGGGRFKPSDCVSRHKVAIIIPFRDRHQHLIQWLDYLHPILMRQQLDYGVYVINQDGEGTFNRAKLMNVGFAAALGEYNYTCFVFSDVDLIPMNDRNIYKCFSRPRHLSVAIDKFHFVLQSQASFGGVVSMSTEQYLTINGFSNNYWGWGAEDDDLYQRVAIKFTNISRPDMWTGRFSMIKHGADLHNEVNSQNVQLLSRTSSTMEEDGLSHLAYTVKKVEKDKLYTFITVDIGGPT